MKTEHYWPKKGSFGAIYNRKGPADQPNGHNSYEYQDEKDIDSTSNEEKGKEDGDRLVGGKTSDTRLSQGAS